MSAQMLAFCMHIIHQGHYKTALEIYYSLPATDIGTLINVSTSGRLLLRKCVKVLNVSIDFNVKYSFFSYAIIIYFYLGLVGCFVRN